MKPLSVSLLVIGVCFAGCSVSEFDSAEKLSAYIASPDHDLSQRAENGEYHFTVTYRPTDLLVDQEIGDGPFNPATVESLRKKYSSYYYFILSLSKNGKEALHQVEGGMGQYSELVQTLSFRMNEYVTLTTSAQDTIPVGDFMLNRTYGLSQSTDILFVFNKEKAKDKDWVQFNLNEFGLGVGNQRFRFKTKDLENVPKINFEQASGKPDN